MLNVYSYVSCNYTRTNIFTAANTFNILAKNSFTLIFFFRFVFLINFTLTNMKI